MVGHQRLSWINNPASSSGSGTPAKQEQETSSDCLGGRQKAMCHLVCPLVGLSALCLLLLVGCVTLSVLYTNESDGRPAWSSFLFDYQNISDSLVSLSTENHDLRRDSELLQEQNARLHQQNQNLNRTSADLMSVNLALSLESIELMEQIVNLTSTNLQLTEEHERLVRSRSEQEVQNQNMSQTIRLLMESNTQRDEERRRLSDINGLLRDELDQEREKNQQVDNKNQQLQQRLTELQEQNQNLSVVLMEERQEAAEREAGRRDWMENVEAEIRSVKEEYNQLDLYCPVVNNKTKERFCRTCPDSWRQFGTKCYFFSSDSLTWSSSRAWCQKQGGDLLVINSAPEQGFIFESSQAEDPSSRLWIGLTDAEQEGDWSWVDGSPLTSDLQFWLSRPGLGTEPDDWKQDDPSGEDCGHIDTSETTFRSWMDGSCKKTYRWICEKDV